MGEAPRVHSVSYAWITPVVKVKVFVDGNRFKAQSPKIILVDHHTKWIAEAVSVTRDRHTAL